MVTQNSNDSHIKYKDKTIVFAGFTKYRSYSFYVMGYDTSFINYSHRKKNSERGPIENTLYFYNMTTIKSVQFNKLKKELD